VSRIEGSLKLAILSLDGELSGYPLATLSDLSVGRYVNTVARVTSLRVREVEDEFGSKRISSGVLEDNALKTPFVYHKTSLPFEKNVILKISYAYVHEFQDRSLFLILTEYTKAETRYYKYIVKYIWHPKTGQIHRPVWNVVLKGIISKGYAS